MTVSDKLSTSHTQGECHIGKIEIGPATREIILPLLKQKRDEIDQLIQSLEGGEEQEYTITSQQTVTRRKTRGPGRPKAQSKVSVAESTGKKCYTSTIQAILRRADRPLDVKEIFHQLQKGGHATTYKQLESILDKCVGESVIVLKGGHYQLPEETE